MLSIASLLSLLTRPPCVQTSGADGWNGVLYNAPGITPGGSTYATYVTFNSWEHSEPLHSAVNAFGVTFTPNGMFIAGGVLNASAYALSTALFSFNRQGQAFSGHYQPYVRGNWTIQVLQK
jgi:hypothetical protein